MAGGRGGNFALVAHRTPGGYFLHPTPHYNREHPMTQIRSLAVAAAAVGVFACAGYGTVDEAAVRQQLAERMTELKATLLAGDVEQFMTFWTEDVRVLEPGVNKEGQAWGAYLEEILGQARVLSLDIEPYETFVHGDAVYEIGQYDETIQLEGQDPVTVANYYSLRWERGTDGLWRIDRFIAGPRAAPEGM